MTEYIDREAAIKALCERSEPCFTESGEPTFKGDYIGAIASIPAADVVELKHGEWIFGVTMHHEWMKCSVCNVSQVPNGCFSYCPNCGAKMDGGADDE